MEKANLGLATTRELLAELTARIEVDGQLDYRTTDGIAPGAEAVFTPPARVLPEDQRVVRTKTSGDKVYLLDDTKKTRQWISNGEVLTGLGFEMNDVTEVDDATMMRYNMGPALYKAPDARAA